jgi:hypothetical protein
MCSRDPSCPYPTLVLADEEGLWKIAEDLVFDLQVSDVRSARGVDGNAETGQAQPVHVVVVLVGDEDGVSAEQGLRLASDTGIDDEDPTVSLQPYAGVRVSDHPHACNLVRRQTGAGKTADITQPGPMDGQPEA